MRGKCAVSFKGVHFHNKGVHFIKSICPIPFKGVQKVARGVHFIKIAVLCQRMTIELIKFCRLFLLTEKLIPMRFSRGYISCSYPFRSRCETDFCVLDGFWKSNRVLVGVNVFLCLQMFSCG